MWATEKYKSYNQPCVDKQLKTILKKMDRPVNRTVSFGLICSGTRTSGDSTARRHSSAGIRALLWASGSSRSFGCSTDSQTSRENLFSNILTPDSIPQFTIPTLSVQSSWRSLDQETEDKKPRDSRNSGMDPQMSPSCTTISSSSSSSCSSLVPPNRKAERCVSDPLTKRRSVLQRETHLPCLYKDTLCLDPESKAALSLPHLAKVTTPYGFVALSQSPQMASEEALLCQAGLCRSIGDNGRLVSVKGSCFHLSGAKKRLSKDTAKPQGKERITREPQASICASAPSSSGPRQPEKLKQRFYHIIKKHFM